MTFQMYIMLIFGIILGLAIRHFLSFLFFDKGKYEEIQEEIKIKKRLITDQAKELKNLYEKYNDIKEDIEKVKNEKINFNVDAFYNSISKRIK